jgi:catechol 2,3-dioxygenase-like lactoylglutathione lyase family enzyme
MINVKQIDHLVFTVKSIENTVLFYKKVLNIDCTTFGSNRKALLFGEQKINLHQLNQELEPKAKYTSTGCNDICLIVDTPIQEVENILNNLEIQIIDGIVTRTGRYGDIKSIYFRDPDGNLIEVSNYI